MLIIKVRYRLDEEEWVEFGMSPEDYFWIDPDEKPEPFEPFDTTNHSSNTVELVPESQRLRLRALETDVCETETRERFLFGKGVLAESIYITHPNQP
ncbi:MAG: hypothetical protein AAGG51_13705 [Cyanobacteria bacterium P01_G01_bin.54]